MKRKRSAHASLVLLAALLLLRPVTSFGWLDPAAPDVVRVLDVADNQFSFYGGTTDQTEWLINKGSASSTRLKGNEDQTGLKFNLQAYPGQIVQEAELHLAKADTQPIFALVAATFNADWQESTACVRYRDHSNSTEWTYPHSDVTTATFGNFGSLACYGYTATDTFKTYTSAGYTWIALKLDPTLMQALILDQYGLMVTDPRGYHTGTYNPRVYTKEQSGTVQPRLYIKFASIVDTSGPGAVGTLTAQAGSQNGQVVLRFTAPSIPDEPKALGYTVRYATGSDFATATNLDRWRIVRPKAPGIQQQVLIENLTPGENYTFFVQAYDRANNTSPVHSVAFTLPPARFATLIDGGLVLPGAAARSVLGVSGVLRYWAASDVIKVNPATGNRMEDDYTSTTPFDDYKKANIIWDSATNTISLTSSRNEMVATQLILERLGSSLSNIRVTVSDLTGPAGATIPANPYMELFQLHYVSSGEVYYPDAAIPLSAPFPTTFAIPDAQHNPGGVNQSVWMDLYVPTGALPGDYTGTITITATHLSAPVTVNLAIRVGRITIPDTPTFLLDLNGYSAPWSYGNTSLTCLRYFQACHKHRAVPNILPYHQNASVDTDRRPTLGGSGPTLHAAGWSTFDNMYGRFLDGTAFTASTPGSPYYGPGANTPITHMYTPFFDSWPINLLDPVYGYDAPPGAGPAYWQNLLAASGTQPQFWADAPDILSVMTDGYKHGVRNVVADWFAHADQKGWTRTAFEIYLNNKYDNVTPPTTLWVTEECTTADDFRAVGFFHQLYRDGQALANTPHVPWHFRIDISDRFGQNYGRLDNLINWQSLGNGTANWYWPSKIYRQYMLDADKQEDWIWYGTGPAPTDKGTGHAQTFLQRWSQGYNGALAYWHNFKTSWTAADSLSIVYSGQSVPGFGRYDGPVLSTRLKMMRQAEQILELLNLWADAADLNRDMVRDALSAKYGSNTWDYSFANLDENQLYQLRADLQAQLESLLFLAGDINGDGTVSVSDLVMLVAAWGSTNTTTPSSSNWNITADLNHDTYVNIGDLQRMVAQWGSSL